ncbi:hypothetical protein MCOR33_004782 [Pyricularia grisea]|uniref:Nuclear GTPase SLIP-GC n=1 Tax=Pyricularia grisea TaxID=148305 RepID=A0ABQ8NM39_PYRGI|nr:hypothetical protein MCOR33_004782 [Pyricularia grisea]
MASPTQPEPGGSSHLQTATHRSQHGASSTNRPPDEEICSVKRLLELCRETSVDKLENGLKLGIELLQELWPVVHDLNSPSGNRHLKTIEGLLQAGKRTRTVIGVVGSTGSGKSSVLNAILNESQLLPTNCMRACTASVTELSFNYSIDPSKRYYAEVEFMSTEDWASELELFWDDLIDSNGKIRPEAKAKDGDARIAFDKVKAVYPTFGKSASSVYDHKELAKEPMVLEVLGTTKKIQAKTAAEFAIQLKPYIDSKERGGNPDVMEAWPLIKVARIYIKADALANGVVLVDLPGVHDSNGARAAVADKFIEECSGLWILAPIQRAVDDKSAKTLMGAAFKEQLKFDGMFDKVTFICSKTDDIPVSEAVQSLKLDEMAQEHWKRVDEIQRKRRRAKVENEKLEFKRDSLEQDKDQKWEELSKWNELSRDFSRGLPVHPPPPEVVSRKRKHRTRQTCDRKDRPSEAGEEALSSEDELADHEHTGSNPAMTQPLTRMEIDQKIASLKETLAQLKPQLHEAEAEIYQSFKTLKEKLKAFKKEEAELQSAFKAMCIKGRNDYSRKAIQWDFALGIKELDEAAQIEKDESSFNPDVDFRGYAKVADSLPVFCVSSRAYQQLCGRNKRDRFEIEGFNCVEDTEIPQLVKHAQGMTEASRVGQCRRFLNELLRLVVSMLIWTSSREVKMEMTLEKQNFIQEVLRRELKAFEQALATAVDLCVTTIENHFCNLIFSTIGSKIPTAKSAAVDRKGQYHGAAGPRNFNRDLLKPIIPPLASAWEKTFQRRVPVALDTFTTSVQTALRVLHTQVTNANNPPGPNQDLTTLGWQMDRYLAAAAGIPDLLEQQISNARRQASRQLTPVIVLKMTPGYRKASEQKGVGLYKHMKSIMAGHVEIVRNTMFEQAKEAMQGHLQAIIDNAEETLTNIASDIKAVILEDYAGVLLRKNTGHESNNAQHLVNNAEQLRNNDEHLKKIAEILATVNKHFSPAYEAAPATGTVKE